MKYSGACTGKAVELSVSWAPEVAIEVNDHTIPFPQRDVQIHIYDAA